MSLQKGERILDRYERQNRQQLQQFHDESETYIEENIEHLDYCSIYPQLLPNNLGKEDEHMTDKLQLRINYFKQTGKFYMEKHVAIPDRFRFDMERLIEAEQKNDTALFNEDISEKFHLHRKKEIFQEKVTLVYQFRIWVTDEIRHNEFIAVIDEPDDSVLYDHLLGYPLMAMPKQK